MTLIEAVRSGNLDRVNAEIAAGADVNLPADDATPLAVAAAAGRKDIVRALVRAGADANWQTDNGDTAMMLAAIAGQTAICEYLAILTEPSECQRAIQHLHAITPPDINDRVDDFIAAAATGEAIESFLAAGIDVDGLGKTPLYKGKTALYLAARNGKTDTVQQLLAAGANPDIAIARDDLWAGKERDCPRCQTRFTAVADRGQCPNCKWEFHASLPDYDPKARSNPWDSAIVDESQPGIRTTTFRPGAFSEGAVPKFQDIWCHHTPLMAAARMGYIDVVRLLLDAGASQEDKTGWNPPSPLYLAVEGGHREIARILIDAGAVLDRFEGTSTDARTPLMVAVEKSDLALVDLLLEAGANVNTRGEFGRSALVVAAELGLEEMVKRLQEAGAMEEGLEAIALQAAAAAGDLPRVQALLDAGVDPNQPEPISKGYSLQSAASRGDVEMVRLLLATGADIDGLKGQAPISAAAYFGQTEMVQILIEAGADVNACGFVGQTALEHAREYQYTEMIPLLEAAGAKTTEDLEGKGE